MRNAIVMIALSLALPAALAGEGSRKAPADPLFQQECGSCHVPFPPRLLGETAWRKLMGSLDKHFGSDATLDPNTRQAIEAYLVANAARQERLGTDGRSTLRITETAWYQREHDEVGRTVWQRPSIKRASNCAACHSQADQGSFSERQIHIPK
jgi:mono/diheme cytochrome c family protein